MGQSHPQRAFGASPTPVSAVPLMPWRWISRPGFAGPHGGATRPVMMGRIGAVAAVHPLGSLVGLDVLREGGNAFDAAVAASAVVSLGEPHMSGVGGGCAATVYHAMSDRSMTLDLFRTLGPSSVDGGSSQGATGLATAAPPGMVAGWAALLDRYGTMKLDRLLRPAVEYARLGVPVSFMLSAVIESVGKNSGPYSAKRGEGFLDPRASKIFMPQGRPLRPGEPLVQEELSATLRTICDEGPTAFYRGRIAREIVEACAAAGGHISAADLGAVAAEWRPSLHGAYRAHEVQTISAQALETLELMSGFEFKGFGFDSADHIHTLIECIKVAQGDRVAHEMDRSFDARGLFQRDHIAQRLSEIDPTRPASGLADELGTPWWSWPAAPGSRETPAAHSPSSETTHLVTADRWGNLVSLTQSLGRHFGSRAMAGNTGILLNDLYPTITGRVWGGVAPSIVMSPAGAPWMTVGSPAKSAETVPQMISHVVDFALNPQAAVEAPRISVFRRYVVMMETRMPEETRAELTRMGHECVIAGEWAFAESQLGRGQMIVRDGTGVLFGASDPRGDGAAQAL